MQTFTIFVFVSLGRVARGPQVAGTSRRKAEPLTSYRSVAAVIAPLGVGEPLLFAAVEWMCDNGVAS